jgi:hypothetical protein
VSVRPVSVRAMELRVVTAESTSSNQDLYGQRLSKRVYEQDNDGQ